MERKAPWAGPMAMSGRPRDVELVSACSKVEVEGMMRFWAARDLVMVVVSSGGMGDIVAAGRGCFVRLGAEMR